jgi:hypothetical protein
MLYGRCSIATGGESQTSPREIAEQLCPGYLPRASKLAPARRPAVASSAGGVFELLVNPKGAGRQPAPSQTISSPLSVRLPAVIKFNRYEILD